MLLNNPVLLAAAGGGLLLVLLLIALIMRRRRSGGGDAPMVASNLDGVDQLDDIVVEDETDQFVNEAAAGGATGVEAEEDVREMAATDEQAADVTAVQQPDGGSDEGARDDVIAEADVYLAYGIYQQAEELLQNAIKDNPDNDSYRIKLAETYSASKNTDGFIELATDVNQRRAGKETPVWKKIVAIGAELAPGHELFRGTAAGKDDDLDMDGKAPVGGKDGASMHLEVQYNSGCAFLETGDYKSAESSFREVLDINPSTLISRMKKLGINRPKV